MILNRTWVRVAVGVVVLAALGGGVAVWTGVGRAPAPTYTIVPISRGDVARTIITTGTISPVATVTVGSYVSGVIQSWSCDYNTKVEPGQVCAKIDPRPYQTIVDQDRAALASAEAQLKKDQAALAYAKVNLARDLRLLKAGAVSQDTVDNDRNVHDQAEAQVNLAIANVAQRKATLEAALVNLDYTDIVAPVEGTVISRNIEVGQTVAASFQTPTLFLIATDLTKMQIDTNVSESDIGEAREGQAATFSVEAYPGRTFTGTVRQVRRAPISVQNVITYNVVIDVENPDLALLPGLTANVRIITAEAKDALVVPAPALRYAPSETRQGGGQKPGTRKDAATKSPRVWVLRDGKPQPIDVEPGVASATQVAITRGLSEGDQVITGEVAPAGEAKRAAVRPPMPRF
jgi:HlyD family secretion protein